MKALNVLDIKDIKAILWTGSGLPVASRRILHRGIFLILLLLRASPGPAAKAHRVTLDELTRQIGEKGGAAVIALEDGRVLYAHRADIPVAPASTIKVAVASLALRHWGRGYRFPTEIYLDASRTLFVRGLGDPCLVSEEIELMASRLADQGIKEISRVVVDDSYFAADTVIPGSVSDDEPYNAGIGALSANFNSVLLRKTSKGLVVSGESQTPITSMARSLGAPKNEGLFRRNIPPVDHSPAVHVGQILVEFLRQKGVNVRSQEVTAGIVPQGLPVFTTHRSSKRLCQVVKVLMKHSNNFMANQIFLSLGAELLGPPATLQKGKSALEAYLAHDLGIDGVEVFEGSGLCRDNQTSAMQMCRLMASFCDNRDLLSVKEGLQAKTGTLSGVRCLAGFFTLDSGQDVCFALMMSQNAPYRWTLADSLRTALNAQAAPSPK